MAEKKEKKERVIHTRVPESLDQELKKRAAGLGVSVSNLVRNVLNHTFGLVEDVINDSARVGRAARGEDEPSAPPAPPPVPPVPPVPGQAPQVLGWQAVVLNLNAVCGSCNTILPKGTAANVGLLDRPGGRPPIICVICLGALTDDGAEDDGAPPAAESAG